MKITIPAPLWLQVIPEGFFFWFWVALVVGVLILNLVWKIK